MAKYKPWWQRTVRFEATLRRPPWQADLIQYEDGWEEALVYFETDVPGEWVYCSTPYTASLRRLEEGRKDLVTGAVYHFEQEGKLFLLRCTISPIEKPH
jgi:hypothetical protein